jgi:hypothetical protein
VSAQIPITDANIRQAVSDWISNPNSAQFINVSNTPYYGNISDWDVSQVTDMSELFRDKTNFKCNPSNQSGIIFIFDNYADISFCFKYSCPLCCFC